MKILLIGGTGVLSNAVAKEAIKQGISVTMINRGNRPERIPSGVTLIKSDKRNIPFIKECLQGKIFDAVIDFLCSSRRDTLDSIELYSNYTKQYFYISSAAVINPEVGGVLTEDSPKPYPVWDYSVNKWESEKVLIQTAQECGVYYTIVRPAITYDDTRIPYDITPTYGYHWTLVERIKNKKPIVLINGGKAKHNIMRVEDFAIGLCGLIGNTGAYNNTFNICSDEAPSFKEVLDTLCEIIGCEAVTIDIPAEFIAKEYKERKGEILGGRTIDVIHSNHKLKSIIGSYRQSISLADGIKLTLNAYIDNKYQKGIDWKYDGDIDRVISAWLKHNNITDAYNIEFVDYLGNSTEQDRKLYYSALNRNTFPYKQQIFLKYLYTRILNIPSRLRREFLRLKNK